MRYRTFRDRREAGRLLAERLVPLQLADPVVLGLPRGGMPVAAEVAATLVAPLDVLLVRKLGAPYQPELAIGAVVAGDTIEVVLNEDIVARLHLTQADIDAERDRQLAVLEKRRTLYRAARAPQPVEGRTAIVVDDGAATGATLRVALRGIARQRPGRLIAAAPVASEHAIELLGQEADEVVTVRVPRFFGAVGVFYRDFSEVSDDEVVALLEKASR
ncbi:MAG: phosphoribosyltransferase [Hyphomicrobiaceae bacterium]